MIRNVVTLTQREVASIFLSLTAYAVLVVFSLLLGWSFAATLIAINQRQPALPSEFVPSLLFGGGGIPVIVALLVGPLITMRLLAEEKKTGTLESLMTAPVGDVEVVLSKFLAGFVFYAVLWVPALVYLVMLSGWEGQLDPGPLLSGLLGVMLLGGLLVATGVFASSVTNNQVIAAIIGLVINLGLYLVPFFALGGGLVDGSPGLKAAFGQMNFSGHLDELATGLIDTSGVVYFLSLTVFFLFLTVRSLEARKWS